jgi:hypothetical protein
MDPFGCHKAHSQYSQNGRLQHFDTFCNSSGYFEVFRHPDHIVGNPPIMPPSTTSWRQMIWPLGREDTNSIEKS